MNGEQLTDALCTIKLGIGDGRRRIKDLLDAGVYLTKELKEKRYNVYFMTEWQKDYNKDKFAGSE